LYDCGWNLTNRAAVTSGSLENFRPLIPGKTLKENQM